MLPSPAPPLLKVEGLQASLTSGGDSYPVLGGLDLEIDRGEFAAVIGPSGCGKSTFFNVLAGSLPADAGRLSWEGAPVEHLRGRVSYMQQKDLLLPWRTLLDNAVLGLEIRGVPRTEARHRAGELLPVFGLEGSENRYPDELSGGMRQRAALLRTMLCRRDLALLDEPFGALDAITRRGMQDWLLEMRERFGCAFLLVTHDVEEALKLADRVWVLSGCPARVRGVIKPELPRPRRSTSPEMAALKERLLTMLEGEE